MWGLCDTGGGVGALLYRGGLLRTAKMEEAGAIYAECLSVTLSQPPEWFGTGKLQHGWIVSEEVERVQRRAGPAEDERCERKRLQELPGSQRHENRRVWNAGGYVVVGKMND